MLNCNKNIANLIYFTKNIPVNTYCSCWQNELAVMIGWLYMLKVVIANGAVSSAAANEFLAG